MAARETFDDVDTAGVDWLSFTGEWTTGDSSGDGSILHQGAVWTTDSHSDSGQSGEDRLSHSSSPSIDSQYSSSPSSHSQYFPGRSTDWSYYCALPDLDSCHDPIGFSPNVCNEPPSINESGLEESLSTSSSIDDFYPALHGNLDDNSTVVSSTLFSPSSTSGDNLSSRRASAAAKKKKQKWQKKQQKKRPQSAGDLVPFETAYKLLIGDGTTQYPHRPYRVRALPTRQIFIERPPAKRQWGGDKWRNSGGKQGGVLVWVKPHSGVRKRYGVLLPEDGGQKLKVQQFSLVRRESASATAPVFEDPSVYMYVVEPCTINGEDHSKPSAAAKQPLTTTSRTAFAAPQQDVLLSTLSGSRQTVKCERKPSSVDEVTVLDFKDVAFRGLARAKRPRSSSPDKLHSPLNRPYSHASQRRWPWPFGTATLTAVSSLLLVCVVAYVGLLQQRPVDIAGDSKCQMGTFRPPHQLLPDCLRCTVCSAHAQVTLRACTAESDTVCGSWGWTRSVADVHITPPPLTAPGVATDISQKPYVQNGQVAQRQHVPQFPATWTSQGVLYSFGGSGDTAAASTAETRLRAAGERCVTQATGITDELWTYQPAGGWNQVAAPAEGEPGRRGTSEVVWPRSRYAATSWGLDDGRGAVFSGDFEFCHNQDYSVPERENLVFVAPDSLYVYNAGGDSEAGDESGWSLLGGSDKWYPLTQMELNQALGVGFLADTYFCSGSRTCSWPLPRARGQGWFLSGRAYLFSGMLSVVDQDFNNLRTQTFLLNDFWSFDPTDIEDHPSNAGGDGEAGSNGGGMPLSQRVAMSRIAACGEYVDAPDVLPADGGPYPGGRFSAALWTNTLDDRHGNAGVGAKAAISRGGWMFGGIGRRSPGKMSADRTKSFVLSSDKEYTRPTDTLGVGSYPGSECVVDSIIDAGEWYPVRNLCDLWIFVPGKGFRLVSACENDAADLSVFNGPVPMVRLSDGPTAGIFATTWVTRNDGHLKLLDSPVHTKGDERAGGSLWMFGGITSCAPFNGVSADGQNASDPLIMGALMDLPKSHAKDACDQPDIDDRRICHETELRGFWLENMTMCDMSLPGHGIAVVGMGSGHPSHQPCTQDLWRFDLLTETWEHMRDLAGDVGYGDHDGWPEARCGALSFSSSPPSLSTTQQSSVSFVGGWGGASSGECEEWPQANSSCAGLLNETGRSDGCQHLLQQSFRSKDLPTLPIRHSRAYPATCRPLAEVWDFELRASRS